MHRYPARAMYNQLGDALRSITMQLRSAIEADAREYPRVNGASGPLQRKSGWARQVSAELASVLLATLGLAATIEWHVRQFQNCTGIPCELTVNNAAGFDLPENYAETLFDIYTEALSNVARHAAASHVAIALTITSREVVLVVADNGVGLGNEVSSSGASGLAAMRARSQAYQGSCEVAGGPNGGTTATVSLPIP
jgi:two-component system, NarL family, sensor histidine kinase UhpB